LRVADIEELPTHGGSLRVSARLAKSAPEPTSRVAAVLEAEREAGLDTLAAYERFSNRVRETKWKLLEFLIQERRAGHKIVAYGAPAKGNTLLNYCGIREDLIDFSVDLNPMKQGKLLPGTRIPIRAPDDVRAFQPHVMLILPWNIQAEVVKQMAFVREWGCRFAVPIPEVRVLP
jgi:hypothetical protein